MGISWAVDFPFSFVIKMIYFDSFLDGANGIDGVTELSTKISLSSTLDFLDIDVLNSLVLDFPKLVLLVKIRSNTHFNSFLFW